MTSPDTQESRTRSKHPFFMYDAIQAQVEAVQRVFEQESPKITQLVKHLHKNNIQRVHLVGIGTSYHAALVGSQWLQEIAQLTYYQVTVWQSFEFVLNETSPMVNGKLTKEDLVLVLSHRGTKQYSMEALKYVSEQTEATTVLFTSIGSQAPVDKVDFLIHTSQPEKSSAFTISHTSVLSALLTLAVELGVESNVGLALDLKNKMHYQALVVDLIRKAMDLESNIRGWITEKLSIQLSPIKQSKLFFVGNGANMSSAYEVALKIKETSYINAEGFQLEQFLHGPFCATDADTTLVTFLVVPPSPQQCKQRQSRYKRTVQIIEAAQAAGARVAIVTQNSDPFLDIIDADRHDLVLPDMPEVLTPLIYLIPLQLFTYWLCLDHPETQTNPDVFRLNDPLHYIAKTKYVTL